MIDAGQTEPVMPVGPGTFAKLSGLGMGEYVPQHIVTDLMDQCLNIGIVTDVHDLRDHSLRHGNGFIRCFPPDVLAGQVLQGIAVDVAHGRDSNTVLFSGNDNALRPEIVLSRRAAMTFSLFGFIIGIWADGFEKLQIVPLMIVTPLTFLGGSFYSITMLPPIWQKIALVNPVVYLISGFRWSFYGVSDVGVGFSVGMTLVFLALCLAAVWWIFRTGYRLKN